MALPLILGLWLAVTAGVLTARSLSYGSRVSRRIAHVQRYGLAAATPDLVVAERSGDVEDPEDVAHTGASRLGRMVVRRLAPARVDTVRRNLLAAGRYDTTAEAFLGMQALSVIGVALLIPVVIAGAHVDPLVSILIAFIGLYVGIAIPLAGLSRSARSRLEEIEREMPELVDVLVVAVEAGVGLTGAVDRAAGRVKGPLGDEMRLVMREHSLGATLPDALGHFAERVPTGGVVSFTRTLRQGERLGVSVGHLLRSAADDMRKRRIAKAQEIAHKTPIKILFPLILLIFPAMFVVLLAPAGMTILSGLGNG
jgi:tight adherence protein C